MFLGSAVAFVTIASVVVGVFVSWLGNKIRVDLNDNQQSIQDMVRKEMQGVRSELKEFVLQGNFREYTSGHSKEHENIISELTRLRDAKHDHANVLTRQSLEISTLAQAAKEQDRTLDNVKEMTQRNSDRMADYERRLELVERS